jgi:acetyl esterase/lipase
MAAFHPELSRAARFLPAGVGRPWLVWLLQRLPFPSLRVPADLTREVVALGTASVRITKPAASSSSPRPVVLWIHGGGYVIGTASQDDGVCQRIARELDAVVVAVDYRLAPQHPFPAPLDDCFTAYDFVQREASRFGGDASRLIIAGQSAGGGLAAALTLQILDRRRPLPRLQALVYPMLDDRTTLRDVDGAQHRLWDQPSNRFGWRAYLGRAPGGDDVVDHAAPARRVDLHGLPPTWIGVGTNDLFLDEDLEYARRLQLAGINTTVEVVEGAFHGFDAALVHTAVSQQFFASQIAAMREAVR